MPGSAFALDEAVVRHLQVLRIAAGETITLFDGTGGESAATLVAIGKRTATATLTTFNPVEREAPISITLVQALATADKMDLIVQKAVELGVAGIVPIATARATLKLDSARAEKRVQHWQAIAVAACEQCGRNRIPVVGHLRTLNQWLEMLDSTVAGNVVLLHPQAEKPLLGNVDARKPITLLIGPEGGFADEEIARAVARKVVPVQFGPRTLRTETAAMAVIAVLAARFGDLGNGGDTGNRT